MAEIIKLKWGIVAEYYSNTFDKIIIWCVWFPGKPKYFDQINNECVKNWFDLIIPDYYGSWRSDWIFTPKNCVQTIIDLTLWVYWWNKYSSLWFQNRAVKFKKYDEIVVVGKSFWGLVAINAVAKLPFVHAFWLIAPVFTLSNQWSNVWWMKEESISEIRDSIYFWYKYFYRWIVENKTLWDLFFSDQLGMSGYNHIENVKNKKIIIVHGKDDKIVAYKKSKLFSFSLKKAWVPTNDLYLQWLWHWAEIIQPSLHYIFSIL